MEFDESRIFRRSPGRGEIRVRSIIIALMNVRTYTGLLLGLLLVSGCTLGTSLAARKSTAVNLATDAGFTGRHVDTGAFSLQTWYRGGLGQDGHLEVYIEGDGLAWRSKRRLSDNPTPVDPVALRLAARVTDGPVLYLARPCQYSDDVERRRCAPALWSAQRYSETVVNAMNRAIDTYVATTGATNLTLIGYSGGGVVATLLAARRDDVRFLITVAANLDHETWTRRHGVTPLSGSLRPIEYARQLGRIPQVHYIGQQDRIVSTAEVQGYLDRLEGGAPATLRIVPGADHDCCWVKQWPELRAAATRLYKLAD